MRLLLVADEEDPYLYDHYRPGVLAGYDAILSAGDLKASYLEFMVTMANRPLYYIRGNHDGLYAQSPPQGCECIEDKLVMVNGLRVLGLGGCVRYSGGPDQYTQAQMRRRIRRLRLALWAAGGVDLVLTHAPAAGLGDQPDPAHRGFDAFLELIDRYHPAYLVHGHVHLRYGHDIPRRLTRADTTLLNANGKYVLEIDPPAPDTVLQRRWKWYTRLQKLFARRESDFTPELGFH